MLDTKTMRAVGMMVARMARTAAPESVANEVIELAPLLEPWHAGTSESPASYAAGDVRTYAGQPWKCAQAHTHRGARLGAGSGCKPVGGLPCHGRRARPAMDLSNRSA